MSAKPYEKQDLFDLLNNNQVGKAKEIYPLFHQYLNQDERKEIANLANKIGRSSSYPWDIQAANALQSMACKAVKEAKVKHPDIVVSTIQPATPTPSWPWGLIIIATCWLIWLAYSQMIANQIHPDNILWLAIILTVIYAGILIWPFVSRETEEARNHLKNP